MKASLKYFLALCGALVAASAIAGPAAGATIEVNTTVDSAAGSPDACSLREAVRNANLDVGANGCSAGQNEDVILVPGGDYKLTIPGEDSVAMKGDLDVYDALEIRPATASDKVTIDGNGLDRVFQNFGPEKFTLRNVTVTGGKSSIGGGGLYAGAAFLLDSVTITGNEALQGGGILVAMADNDLGEIVNSTISGNDAVSHAGGIGQSTGTLNVRSSTIVNNRADIDKDDEGEAGGVIGGSIDSTLNLWNTILAHNVDLSPTPDKQTNDCFTGPFFFPRYTISTQAIGAGDCLVGFDPGTNKTVPDASLLALADNGGQTPTHKPAEGSPVIDAGGAADPDLCPEVDQTGVARPAAKCDIGAVEYVAPKPPDDGGDGDGEGNGQPEVTGPTPGIVAFDGKNLHIRLFCPKRFKPVCQSKAMPVTKRSKKGKPMAAKAAKVKIRSGRWKNVKVVVKPAFRAKVKAMAAKNVKLLHVKQVIRSKRIRTRKFRGAKTIFHTYKVRTLAK